jgi:hypothetical protein
LFQQLVLHDLLVMQRLWPVLSALQRYVLQRKVPRRKVPRRKVLLGPTTLLV